MDLRHADADVESHDLLPLYHFRAWLAESQSVDAALVTSVALEAITLGWLRMDALGLADPRVGKGRLTASGWDKL